MVRFILQLDSAPDASETNELEARYLDGLAKDIVLLSGLDDCTCTIRHSDVEYVIYAGPPGNQMLIKRSRDGCTGGALNWPEGWAAKWCRRIAANIRVANSVPPLPDPDSSIPPRPVEESVLGAGRRAEPINPRD